MTDFAPVAPLVGLRRLAESGLLGNYQLLIAPIVLKREEAYVNFFVDHNDQFVILDNGVIELGYPLDAGLLANAAQRVDANVVVMPDTIDDGKMTVKQVAHSLPEFRRYSDRAALGVVQGVTFEECMECARQLVDLGVDWLAVPRGLTPNLGSRVPLVQAVGNEFGLPMHVLGFSNNIRDDIEAAVSHRLVRGIDAATPVWSKALLPAMPPADEARTLKLGRRPKEFWTMQPNAERVAANVQTVRRWLNDALTVRTLGQGPAAPSGQPTQT